MSDFPYTPAQIKWLEALESGGYEQCQKMLYDGKGYCCLGLACMTLGIAAKPVGPASWEFDGQEGHLSGPAMVQLGLRDHYGASNAPGQEKLTHMNDTGATFPQIAARVRHHPKAYLTNLDA